jgi:hypothetical protein
MTDATKNTASTASGSKEATVSEAGLAASQGVTEAQYRSLEQHWNEHHEVKPGFGRRLITVGGESVAVYRKLG